MGPKRFWSQSFSQVIVHMVYCPFNSHLTRKYRILILLWVISQDHVSTRMKIILLKLMSVLWFSFMVSKSRLILLILTGDLEAVKMESFQGTASAVVKYLRSITYTRINSDQDFKGRVQCFSVQVVINKFEHYVTEPKATLLL